MTTPKRKPGNAETAPKTTAQRQEALRARRLAEGLTEVRGLYLAPDKHAALKKLAKTMTHKATPAG